MVALLTWIWLWCRPSTASSRRAHPRTSTAIRSPVATSCCRRGTATFRRSWTIRDDLDRIAKWGIGIRREDGSWEGLGSRESRGAGGAVGHPRRRPVPRRSRRRREDVERGCAPRHLAFCQALGNRLKDPRRPLRFYIQQNLHPEDLTSKLVKQGTPRLGIPVEFKPERRAPLYTTPYDWSDPRTSTARSCSRRATRRSSGRRATRLGTHGKEAQYNCDRARSTAASSSATGGGSTRRAGRSCRRAARGSPSRARRAATCRGPRVATRRSRRSRVPLGSDASRWRSISSSAPGRRLRGHQGVGGGRRRSVPHRPLAQAGWLRGEHRRDRGARRGVPGLQEAHREGGERLGDDRDAQEALPAVVAQKPIGSKDARLAAIAPTIEAGNGYIPLGPEWVDEFVDELAGATAYDDQADTTSYAILDLNSGKQAPPDGGWSG
jgi:hypothetical protein